MKFKFLLFIFFLFTVFISSCCSWCNENCVKIKTVDVVKKIYKYPHLFAEKTERPNLNVLKEEEGYCSINNVEKEIKDLLELYFYIKVLETKIKYYEDKIKDIQKEEEEYNKNYEIEKKKLENINVIPNK